MTKFSMFDKNWTSDKNICGFLKWQNSGFLTILKNWKKLHRLLRKWQNWAFLTKLKKRRNRRVSQKMTTLSLFDKIVWYITTHSVHIVYLYLSLNLKSIFQKWQNGPFLTKLKKWKKSTCLSENDKIEHFWQNWRIEKIHGPLTKWQKLSIFDKIEDAKKCTGLSQNDKMEHIWQNWRSEKNTRAFSENDKI